jgi:hypothetical protein
MMNRNNSHAPTLPHRLRLSGQVMKPRRSLHYVVFDRRDICLQTSLLWKQ